MEQPPRAVPRSPLYKPAKLCVAFVALTGLGLVLVYGLMQLTARPSPAVVRTTSGPVEGLGQTSSTGVSFYSFEGLPYAQPPLGPLRFKDPQLPPPTWKRTFVAKKQSEACLVVQRGAEGGYVGAEDCLYLNVYTPQLEGAAPVMVWLGSGSFGARDAPRRPRVERLVEEGVVVVTVEYRRGLLGFLGTGDSGNFGLKDQVAALRWVNDNMAAFGGDAAMITLIGVGAGAASVGFHMLSPLSKGLFSRAIAMGGSPLNPWAFSGSARNTVMIFSRALPSNDLWNSSHVADYLRTLTVSELLNRLPDTHQGWDPALSQLHTPSIEPASSDAFMTDAPWSVLAKGLPNAVPFLTGSTSAEGKHLLKVIRLASLEQDFLQLLSPLLRRSNGTAKWWGSARLVRSFYFGDDAVSRAAGEDVLNLLTDTYYLEGVDRMARSVAALSPYPVYYYHFTRDRNYAQDSTEPPGAMHGEDAYAILDSLDTDQESGPRSEAGIDEAWLSMLIEFIKTGDPSAAAGVSWPPYTAEDPAYLEVGSELRTRRDLLPARMDFWRSLLPRPKPPQMSASPEYVTVRVSEGLVRGRRATTVHGGSYISFQGLPYARPPVGELRFQPPQPAESWSGVQDALAEGPACIQFNLIVRQLIGSEDCLYLNIYTPQVPNGDGDGAAKLPVMVWLHGGGFVEGSGTAAAHGPDFLVDSGVILVTVNYRLGVLGFLSTGDSVVPGNMGLKDQVAALHWVKDNIANFGGDPRNVILSGVSAGASSAVFHMMSPLSKGLFHRVIAMGGSPLNPWSFSETAKERSYHLAENFGLKTKDSEELVSFLRTIPAEKFPESMRDALNDEDRERLFMFVFVPSVEPNIEGAFLTQHPVDILHTGKYMDIPLLAGVASREGKFLMKFTGLADDPEKLKHVNDSFINVIGPDLRLSSKDERDTAANKIREFYFGGKPVTNETSEQLVDLLSDMYFLEGMNSTVSSMATKGKFPIYFYRFSYEGTLSPISVFTYNGVAGASHGEDGGYLFTMGETPLNLNPQSNEQKVRKMIVKMWTNFMKSGVPTEEPDDEINIAWPKYTLKEHEFLDINVKLSIQRELEPRRLGFWREILPS